MKAEIDRLREAFAPWPVTAESEDRYTVRLPAGNGFLTVFTGKRRAFAPGIAGWAKPGGYSGRGWLNRLVADAKKTIGEVSR